MQRDKSAPARPALTMKGLALAAALTLGACAAPGGGGGGPIDPGAGDTGTMLDALDTSGGETAGPTATDTSDTAGPELPPVEGAPVILSLSTDVRRITEGDRFRVSAVVTDPDGIDDLIGGTLKDPASGQTYGAFATSAAEGAYAFDLGWDDLERVSSISFASELERVLHAEFFDVAGHRTVGEVRMLLQCGGYPACGGSCGSETCGGGCHSLANYDYDRANCGRCGNACAQGQSCDGGVCTCDEPLTACGGGCVDTYSSASSCGGCGIVCPSGTCDYGECRCDGGGACPSGQACFGVWPDAHRCFESSGLTLNGMRLEYDVAGETLAVCSDLAVANVVCRQLVGPSAVTTLENGTYTSSETVRFECDGDEASLDDCTMYLDPSGCDRELWLRCTDPNACTPACAGRTCGPDGCGGTCGACAGDCLDGQCQGSSGVYLDTTGTVGLHQTVHYTIPIRAGVDVVIETTSAVDIDMYASETSAHEGGFEYQAAIEDTGYEVMYLTPRTTGTLYLWVFGAEAGDYTIVAYDP